MEEKELFEMPTPEYLIEKTPRIPDKDKLILVAEVGTKNEGTLGTEKLLLKTYNMLTNDFDDTVKILISQNPESRVTRFYCPAVRLSEEVIESLEKYTKETIKHE